LLGTDPAGASQRYLSVLSIDPDNAEAHTYTGWLLAISTQNQTAGDSAATLEVAKKDLERAIEIDPTFPDPRCFLAVIAARFENDMAVAKVRAAECLANNPPTEMRGMIEAFAGSLDSAPTTS
jgi:Tfp pilus assembly protein PilF